MPDPIVQDPGSPQSITVNGGTPPPVPTVASGGAPTAPPAELPIAQGQPKIPQATFTPPTAAPAAAQSKSSMLGSLAKSLFNTMDMRTTEWKPDANGNMQAVAGPKENSTSIFKHILAGAIMGGAAAQDAKAKNPYIGPGAGAVAGAAGEQKFQYQQDEKNKEQAQQAYEKQQQLALEKKKTDIEQQRLSIEEKDEQQKEMMNHAQMQRWNVEELNGAQTLNLQSQERLDRINAQSDAMMKYVLEGSGKESKIPGNGQMGNGQAMMDYFNKHPEQLNSSDKNSVRMTVKQVDTTGLHYDAASWGYKDEKGNRVNLEDRTTWHLFDVPVNAVNELVPISGRELRKLYPQGIGENVDDKATYNIPRGTLIAIGASERAQQRSDTREEATQNREMLMTTVKGLDANISALEGELRTSQKNDQEYGNGKESENTTNIRGQIDGYRKEKDKYMAGVNPQFRSIYEDELAASKAVQAQQSQATASTLNTAPLGSEESGVTLGNFRNETEEPKWFKDNPTDALQLMNHLDDLKTLPERYDYIEKQKIPESAKQWFKDGSRVGSVATPKPDVWFTANGIVGHVPANKAQEFMKSNPNAVQIDTPTQAAR